MMLRRLVSFIIAVIFIVEGSFVYASPFIEMEHMYGNAMYKLKTNGPIQRTYDTPTGQLEFRLTYPYQKGKACHVQAWMNSRKVYDYYLPAVDNGYMTRIYKDQATGRIFISFSSYQKSILMVRCIMKLNS